MKLTTALMEWINTEYERRYSSYSEIARASGTSYKNWADLLQRRRMQITPKMEAAICRAFNVTLKELFMIAEGNETEDGETKDARGLWRWLRGNENRLAALRAMGYDGELPKKGGA